MKKILILIFVFLSVETCFSQQEQHAFMFGEKVSYDVYYNWQFVWIKAAEVTFETKEKIIHGKSYYHFDSKGGTLPNYEWIYKVNDRYQAIADTSSLWPIKSKRNIQEGKNVFINTNTFNFKENTIISKIKKEGATDKIDTIRMKKPSMDVLTAIYCCRNIDFSKMEINDTIPLSVIIDDEIFPLYIRFLGYELFENKNDQKFNTIKFKVLLVEGTIFSGGEDMTVWVTNDKNRIPINVEANILVGSIQAVIRSIEAEKYK